MSLVYYLIFFQIIINCDTVASFRLHAITSKVIKGEMQVDSSIDKLSRRQALSLPINLLALLGSAAIPSLPRPAHADVMNTIAYRSALRTVKSASKELENMATLASTNDYAGIKQALRVPPFTEVRRTCNILIREITDADEALQLQKNYADFIRYVEELDTSATLGMRGRKNIQLQPSFQSASNALGAFVEVAQRSVVVPVAFAE
jgi:hypothetical protein